eukprot:1136375-Pelagomonas_calceolata.AAC.1
MAGMGIGRAAETRMVGGAWLATGGGGVQAEHAQRCQAGHTGGGGGWGVESAWHRRECAQVSNLEKREQRMHRDAWLVIQGEEEAGVWNLHGTGVSALKSANSRSASSVCTGMLSFLGHDADFPRAALCSSWPYRQLQDACCHYCMTVIMSSSDSWQVL